MNEEFVESTIKAITSSAKTGEIGDGKIFVLDLKECIRIRTAEKRSGGYRLKIIITIKNCDIIIRK